QDGRVLIAGGSDERDGRGAYVSAEIYDPRTGKFTATGDMNAARYKLQGTSVLLKDGKVLFAGGSDKAEIFDPATNTFSYVHGSLGTNRFFATATLLRNGHVLITGGYDDSNAASAHAWEYRSSS
ncbi:MAG TPA: kelch repeat-containing protein, partial [Sphingomicrobium sp.]|nr:kelch repeat-containing protein [Sphingomicrobium sp.]